MEADPVLMSFQIHVSWTCPHRSSHRPDPPSWWTRSRAPSAAQRTEQFVFGPAGSRRNT